MVSDRVQELLDAARRKVVDRSQNPLLSDLPEFVLGYRPHQVAAIEAALAAFEGGAQVVVVDAPTGSGKTLIGESIRRLLDVGSAVYMCSTKSLQEQFLADYPYAKVLKGRSNYPTINAADRFKQRWDMQVTCADCTKKPGDPASCQWCPMVGQCPYERAKREALSSSLAVLNTSYFLTECNGPGRFSGRKLVVADEADTLEKELMNYVSLEISKRRAEQLHIPEPKKVTVASSWLEWCNDVAPLVENARRRLPLDPVEVRQIREKKYLDGLAEKLEDLRAGLESDSEAWVYTGKNGHIAFKPSHVDKYGKSVLWRHSPRWLLMSATVISAGEMLESLGFDGDWEEVRVPSTFPVQNRLVKVKPVGSMSHSAKDSTFPKLLRRVEGILADHPNDRVLVHTVSYDLMRKLEEGLKGGGNGGERTVLSYSEAGQRDATLETFKRVEAGVLLAPSMERGIDLPGDLCRVQILAKVPFPNLGDRQVSARLHSRNGQVWFTVQAVRAMVQMTGRAVRSEDDWAVTYILDGDFVDKVWNKSRHLFPRWWMEAVTWR